MTRNIDPHTPQFRNMAGIPSLSANSHPNVAEVVLKKVKDLLAEWESMPATQLTVREYTIRLPIRDAARLEALSEMYPDMGISIIMTDLLSASLDELESAMPYVQGERVIEEDEFGDPVFEDKGPSPRFHQLTRGRARDLRAESTGGAKNGQE